MANSWQDAAKTVPVAADGDPIRVVEPEFGSGDTTAPNDAARPVIQNTAGDPDAVFDGVDDDLQVPVTTPGTLFVATKQGMFWGARDFSVDQSLADPAVGPKYPVVGWCGIDRALTAAEVQGLEDYFVARGGAVDPVISVFRSTGAGGVYFDPSNPFSVWNDAAQTTPASVGGVVGAAQDKSGNDTAAVTQGSTASKPLLQSDGTTTYFAPDGVDDFLSASPTPFEGVGFPYTIGVWVNPAAAITEFHTFVVTHSISRYTGIALQVNGVGEIVVRFGDGTGTVATNRRTYITNDTLPIDQWSFIYVECRGLDDLDIYLDNTSRAFTSSGSASTVAFTGGALSILAASDLNEFSPMRQSKTMIFNAVLSQSERTAIYEAGP